ncbi:MAG: nucleotidyltransferase domain-containing protein [Planctomycetota bacterium]|nr:MAG: nucleotidyltransferase domain-containing protein [Planctomycetota bacterium]
MPVRSLTSAVLRWPAREEVLACARRWARALGRRDPVVEEVWCVGSCARGDWGVGSDLDVVVIVGQAPPSPVERRARYEPEGVPVPADLWVYTREEWERLARRSPHVTRRWEAEKLDLLSEGASPTPGRD